MNIQYSSSRETKLASFQAVKSAGLGEVCRGWPVSLFHQMILSSKKKKKKKKKKTIVVVSPLSPPYLHN